MASAIRSAQPVLARVFNAIVALSMALFLLAPVSAAYADEGYCRTWKEYQKTDEYAKALGDKEAPTWNMVSDAMDILFEAGISAFESGDADAE